jgi:hypothetical protein
MFGVGNQEKIDSWADKIAIGSLELTEVPVMEADKQRHAVGTGRFQKSSGGCPITGFLPG